MKQAIQDFGIESIALMFVCISFGIYEIWSKATIIKDRYFPYRNSLAARVEKLEANYSMLLDSDKARIKGEILREHTHCMKQAYVEPYRLEYIHQLFDIYVREGGNSFVEELIRDIDKLPTSNKS